MAVWFPLGRLAVESLRCGAVCGCCLAQGVRLALFRSRLGFARASAVFQGLRLGLCPLGFASMRRGEGFLLGGECRVVRCVLPHDLPHPLASAVVGVGGERSPGLGDGRQPIVVAVDEPEVGVVRGIAVGVVAVVPRPPCHRLEKMVGIGGIGVGLGEAIAGAAHAVARRIVGVSEIAVAAMRLGQAIEGVVAEALISIGIERVRDAGEVAVRVQAEREVLDRARRLGREPVIPIEGADERDPVAVGQ